MEFDPSKYVRHFEQLPEFGIGMPIRIAVDKNHAYTVFDMEGCRLFGPVAFGTTPPDHPTIAPQFLRVNMRTDNGDTEIPWARDLMMMAGHYQRRRLTAHLGDIDLHGPSLAPLAGRIAKDDDQTVKALGLWHTRVELLEDIRGLGAWLPAGTIGAIGNGAYAYAMGGMFSYDVELPVTDLEPHGCEKTIGIKYGSLRLLKRE